MLARHYRPFWHTVAAAIRGQDGRIWTGLHLGATVGRLSICAEAVALGRAVLEGDGTIDTVVAVRHPKPDEADRELAVVPPCGACREMFLDHCPDALVIVHGSDRADPKLPVRDTAADAVSAVARLSTVATREPPCHAAPEPCEQAARRRLACDLLWLRLWLRRGI